MLGAAENFQAGQGILGDDVPGHHAADGQLHGQLRLLLHELTVLGFLQTAHIAGVGAVKLLIQLLAGEDCLLCVDDDDEVPAVGVGGVFGLVLAPQQGGATVAVFPRGLPAASRMYHLRTMLPLFAIKVDIGSNLQFQYCFRFPNMVRRAGGFSRFTKGTLLPYNAGETTGRDFEQATL